MIYIIGGLVLALSVTGYMLKTSWQANATHEANALQYEQAIRETSEELAEEVARGDRLAELHHEARQERQRIAGALTNMRSKLESLKRDNNDVQDFYRNCGELPDDLYHCLRTGTCRAANGNGDTISTDAIRHDNPDT